MKVLTLSCQRGYQPGLEAFLQRTLKSGAYDFILLQEFGKEVPSFVRGVKGYHLLQALNTDVGQMSQTCIFYRTKYSLSDHSFIPFAKMRRDPVMGFKHATFGSLCARFFVNNEAVILGSVHLHSGIDRSVRAAQVGRIKEQVTALVHSNDRVIFGGDCNFGLPRERARAERILAPQFICVTKDIGPTLDGRYSENVPHLPNRIAAVLGFFGIKTPLWTDHLFVDAKTAARSKIECRILPDRVSDHSPVEAVITPELIT